MYDNDFCPYIINLKCKQFRGRTYLTTGNISFSPHTRGKWGEAYIMDGSTTPQLLGFTLSVDPSVLSWNTLRYMSLTSLSNNLGQWQYLRRWLQGVDFLPWFDLHTVDEFYYVFFSRELCYQVSSTSHLDSHWQHSKLNLCKSQS